jgi:hypothetical protein
MLNEDAARAVAAARIDENLGKPLYDTYGFTGIPKLVRHVLTGEGTLGLPASVLEGLPKRYDKVVLFLLDGFGWRFFAKYAERFPFLARFLESGVASKLTTQFPSTTATHIATLHTGLPVEETGMFEWWYYEPALDRVFAPLPFVVQGERATEPAYAASPYALEQLFPTRTIYRDLGEAGVPSYCLQHRAQASSAFSRVVTTGATSVPFRTLPEGMVNLTEVVAREKGKAYFCVYVDVVDGISHAHGPTSRQVEVEIEMLLHLLESVVHASFEGRLERTLLLVTADHGQTAVASEKAIYLDERLPQLAKWSRTTEEGWPLAPAGGPRDMFLYVRDSHLEEAESALRKTLRGEASVFRTSQLLAEGYFGPRPSKRLEDRLGNLVVLPHGDGLVWWRGKGRYDLHYKGHHGGLSADEMETLLLAYAYE